MFYVLEAVNIAAILLMLSMLVVVIRQQPSRAQMAFVLYDVFTVIFVIGVQLELMHADTVGEALSGLCVQYVGQAGFLMALLWFASEFAYLKIPGWIYIIQAAINTVVLVGVFTAEHNPYFYNSMKILNDGMYQRINVSGGIIWKMHYIHMAAVLLTIQICCGVRYRQSTATQKKRILYIAAGNGIFALELILKGLGVFGSYNPVVCAMTITMFCMMMAMVKYGYFGSLHAAVDNAFNHGDEGLLVLSNENTIIFVNARMNAMYPGIREGERISKYPDIIEVLKKEDHMLEWGEEIYELRTESIIEHEEKSGMMLWFINQTQQLKQMEELRTANEIKQNILIQISHKLRTPMNAMLGMNEMILRESKEEQVLEYAKETEKAGEQMLALIEKAIYEAEKATGEEISGHSDVPNRRRADVTADIDTTANTDRTKQISDLSNKWILAADDNTTNLKVLKHLLKKTNVHLETVIGGEAAIEACRKRNYDLIFLDHLMPQPDGIATLHQIQEDTAGRNRYTTVIVLTANALPGAEQMYLKEGFADYITKPIKPKELERLLGRYLGWESDEQEAKTVPEGIFHVLEQGEINVTNGLQFADGDVEFYRNLLEMFIKEYEEKREKIHTTDIDEYFIAQVHGSKGEARGIGAERLGNLFEELEETAKQGNSRQVEELLPEAMQEWERIEAWLEYQAPDENKELYMMDMYAYLIKIRCYLLNGKHMMAIVLAKRLINLIEPVNRYMDLCECYMLSAMACYKAKDNKRLCEELQKALDLAKQYGYYRLLADEGACMVEMLKIYHKEAGADSFTENVLDLAGSVASHFPDYLKSPGEHYGALTEREAEVLRLMARGMSNDMIAEELDKKVGTVKFHTANIFKKLKVQNRQQAVERGYEIGFIGLEKGGTDEKKK